jgi:hypothetical protein
MLSSDIQLGSTTQGTTFADIIINTVNGVADGVVSGFSNFVHDPKSLKTMIQGYLGTAIPQRFSDAVALRRTETQSIDSVWDFPLNSGLPNTCPLPWTFVQSTVKSKVAQNEYEFNIMRTVDFIGRNYIKITLPQIDTSTLSPLGFNGGKMTDPDHIYLGAWHRDLIPRLIAKVQFYPRSSSHILFEYSGYDIYVHNVLFGNIHKEMNDLMAGEDKFELCYDPYRVDGSALGLASYKGFDSFTTWNFTPISGEVGTAGYKAATSITTAKYEYDGIPDFFQYDTYMDEEQFREFYRQNVWYENPVAQPYSPRHSIHSRRLVHQAKDITIPLDILPFGYSIGSSLASAAIAGETGFIKLILYENWLDRAFYLTKMSDIPSLHPIVNHLHYEEDDYTPEGFVIKSTGEGEEEIPDPREGWVNERSLGHFGDPEFARSSEEAISAGNNNVESSLAKEFMPPTNEGGGTRFNSKSRWSQKGVVLGMPSSSAREGILPAVPEFKVRKGHEIINGGSFGLQKDNLLGKNLSTGYLKHTGLIKQKTNSYGVERSQDPLFKTGTASPAGMYIYRMSEIDEVKYNDYIQAIRVRLLQVGYQTLPCIREFLIKLPNVYITTEWDDKDFDISTRNFDILNDLYIQAVVLWFCPTDGNGLESLRVYPHHMVDHELPLFAGLRVVNEQQQGTFISDAEMLTVINTAQMEMDPLRSNMGIISFAPKIQPNALPHAFYDSNTTGFLKMEFLQSDSKTGLGVPVNLKSGKLRVITIGVNGCASVNLNLYRLVF